MINPNIIKIQTCKTQAGKLIGWVLTTDGEPEIMVIYQDQDFMPGIRVPFRGDFCPSIGETYVYNTEYEAKDTIDSV